MILKDIDKLIIAKYFKRIRNDLLFTKKCNNNNLFKHQSDNRQ